MSSAPVSVSKKIIHRDVFLASVLTFVILFLIKLVFFNTHYLDPISQPLSDFQFTDLYYSQFKKQKTEIDTNIVIINIGELGRDGIVQQLEIVKSFHPKVIGLDVTFLTLKEPRTDSVLKDALHGDVPIVLTSNITYPDEEQHSSDFVLQSSHPFFEKNNDQGFGNFLAEEGQTVRYYTPFLTDKDRKIPAFTTRILQSYNEQLYNSLADKGRKTEIINYRTNVFAKLDVSDVYSGADLSFLNNKIVLFGYMGPSFAQLVFEDNHLTPLNKSYGGHAIPDKYGIEIHANILSMVLQQAYINEMPKWITYFIAFLVCMLHTYFFIYLFVHHHKWFHLGVKVMQLLSFGIIVFLALLIYGWFDFKLEPGYIVIGVLLSGDAIYFYEAFVLLINKKFHFDSQFAQNH